MDIKVTNARYKRSKQNLIGGGRTASLQFAQCPGIWLPPIRFGLLGTSQVRWISKWTNTRYIPSKQNQLGGYRTASLGLF